MNILKNVYVYICICTYIYTYMCMYTYSLVSQSSPTLCDPMGCSTPGFPVLYHLSEFAQTHVH